MLLPVSYCEYGCCVPESTSVCSGLWLQFFWVSLAVERLDPVVILSVTFETDFRSLRAWVGGRVQPEMGVVLAGAGICLPFCEIVITRAPAAAERCTHSRGLYRFPLGLPARPKVSQSSPFPTFVQACDNYVWLLLWGLKPFF